MNIKLIPNEHVAVLAVTNAREELKQNRNFKFNKELVIDDVWITEFYNCIKEVYEKYQVLNLNRSIPEMDLDLFEIFSQMSLEARYAASTEFWGSISIQNDVTLDLIKLRWNMQQDWFREKITGVDKIEYKYRRYAGNQPHWQTFMRIWWLAKLVPESKKDVLFKQQDFADKSMMNKYVLWSTPEKEEKKYISRTMELLLDRVEQFDDDKTKDDRLKSVQRQAVTRQVFEWMTILKDTTMIDLMSTHDLRIEINDLFEKAILIEQEKLEMT